MSISYEVAIVAAVVLFLVLKLVGKLLKFVLILALLAGFAGYVTLSNGQVQVEAVDVGR